MEISRGRFARDIGGTLGTTILTMVIVGAQSVIIARSFGPSGKGLIALVLLLPGMLSPLVGSGFAASVVYFASRAPIRAISKNLVAFTVAASTLGLVLIAVLWLTGALGSVAPGVQGAYLLAGCVALPLAVAQSVLAGLLAGLGQIGKLNALRLIQSVGGFVAVTGVVWVGRGGTLAVCAALVGASLASLAVHVAVLTRLGARFGFGWDTPLLRRQLAYAAKDHPGAILQFLNYRLDQIVVSAYLGTSGLGLYSVSVTLGELLWIFPDAVSNVVFPRASRERLGEGRRSTMVSFGIAVVLALVGALGLAALGRHLITWLYSGEFVKSYAAMLWLLPGAALLGPAKILANDLAGRGYPVVNSACAGVGMALTLVFDLLLIPAQGIRGAAMASSISYVTVAALVIVAFVMLPSHAEEGTLSVPPRQ